jgi:hypothetical protein
MPRRPSKCHRIAQRVVKPSRICIWMLLSPFGMACQHLADCKMAVEQPHMSSLERPDHESRVNEGIRCLGASVRNAARNLPPDLWVESIPNHKAAPCLTQKAAPGILLPKPTFLVQAGRGHNEDLPPDTWSVLFILLQAPSLFRYYITCGGRRQGQ